VATKAQKVKVGVFLLINIAIFVGGVLLLTGYKQGEQINYWCEFEESILGLNEGAVVEYLGVPVGTVTDIWVTERNTAHVEIIVEADKVTLRQGVDATLVIYSLATGVMYISLAGGDGDPLPWGAEIPTAPSLAEKIRSQAQNLLDDLANVSDKINLGLEGMEEGQLTEVIENANGLITDAREVVGEAGETMDGINANLQPAISDFREGMTDIRTLSKNLDELVVNLNDKIEPLELAETEQELQNAAAQVGALAERLQSTAEVLDTMATGVMQESSDIENALRGAIERLSETLESITNLADYLRQDPASVVRGPGNSEEK
jgi:phospholipid/cholesterol/gamma-HCH transport system substrate-binding protein